MSMRQTVISTALLALALASVAATRDERFRPGPGEPTLAEVREATARFRDVRVALAEGYIRDPNNLCETADMMGRPVSDGAMGIHYFRPDLLGITAPAPRVTGTGMHTDFRQPAVLIYEPQADGSLALVAVENLVFAAAWHAAGHKIRPSFHGVPYDAMADNPATPLDEAHMFESHFDRHVWVHRANPKGVFAPFNPAVSCAAHTGPAGHLSHVSREVPDHAPQPAGQPNPKWRERLGADHEG